MPVSRSCPTPRPPWLFCRAGSRTTTPFTRTPACDSSRLASSAASVLNPPSYLSGQTGCTPSGFVWMNNGGHVTGCIVSSTKRTFSAVDQRRRRCTEVMTSTRGGGAKGSDDIVVFIGASLCLIELCHLSGQNGVRSSLLRADSPLGKGLLGA